MMRRILIGGLILVGLSAQCVLAGSSVEAAQPCAEEMARFCRDVRPGGGRLLRCLQQHQEELAPVCAASLPGPDRRPGAANEQQTSSDEKRVGSPESDGAGYATNPPGILTQDCTAHHPRCPPLAISGDAPQQSKFHGFADPSMRRDPNTGTLWLAYSWPHVLPSRPRLFSRLSRPTIAVDIHLAQSRDDGRTWTYAGPLWQSHPVTNPVTGAENITSHEVANLWPRDQQGTTVWYAVHLAYLVKPKSFIYSQLGGYSYFSLSAASSPTQLADAPSQILGFGGTVPGLRPDVNLSALSPDLNHCTIWNEPALTMQGDTLYLAAQCLYVSDAKLAPAKNFYAIFSTQPQGAIKAWRWRYHGKLAGPAEAAELEHHQFWVQLDFAQQAWGTLLAILTPSDVGTTEHDTHYGCRVLQVASLDSPALARDASGKLIVLASVTASDLMTSVGPAACAYEPSATTGIIMTRRVSKDPVEGYYWTLHDTGLKP